MPEQNIFKGIDNRDINEYISSSADRKKSKVSQMIDNLREASLNVKTYEEAEKLAEAGIGGANKSSAQDVLTRLQRQQGE